MREPKEGRRDWEKRGGVRGITKGDPKNQRFVERATRSYSNATQPSKKNL